MSERDKFVGLLRGLCISSKDDLSARQLARDYVDMVGQSIRVPVSKLGFPRFEDFLKSATDTFVLTTKQGELYVRAKLTKESAHIREMVNRQQAKKKRSSGRGQPFFRPPRLAHTTPPVTSRWRPKATANFSKKYPSISHNSSHAQHVKKSVQFVEKSSFSKAMAATLDQPMSYSQRAAQNHIGYKTTNNNTTAQQIPKSDMEKRLNQHRFTDKPTESKENSFPNRSEPSQYSLQNASTQSKPQSQPAQTDQRVPHVGLARTSSLTPSPTPSVLEEINPLNSSKARLRRMMSELSTEDRDSGNSSPVSDISPPSPKTPEEFPRTGDPYADLKAFAEMYKLGEVEVSCKTIATNKGRGPNMVTCKLQVGKHSYTSYPKDFTTVRHAQSYCCETALADLIPKYQKRRSLLISSDKDILERIPQMIAKHIHGVWSSQLRLDYTDKFNEQLPPDWLKIVDSSPLVQLEKTYEDHILRPHQPNDGGEFSNALSGFSYSLFDEMGTSQIGLGVPITTVSVPSNTVKFDKDDRLTAEVTCAMSAHEIWLQQTHTKQSEDYAEMVDRMQVYYSTREERLKPVSIMETGHYVAKYDENYFRVKALSVRETEVCCFFIDYGDEMTIPRDAIFELKREYATAQAQAFMVRLAGLEDLYEVSANSEALRDLVDKPVSLEFAVDQITAQEENIAVLNIPVYMYDLETGTVINEQLINKLTMESASPYLRLQNEKIINAYVTNIEPNGDIYVQLRTYGFERFKSLEDELEAEVTAKPPTHLLQKINKVNSRDKLYFAKNPDDGHWYRIKLIDWSPDGVFAQVYYVDVGNTAVITVDNEILYPLDNLSDVLNAYPPQATRLRMAGLDQIPDNFVSTASAAMPFEDPVLLKLVKVEEEGGIHLAEFYKRSSSGDLLCITKSITMEVELRNKENEKSRSRNGSPSNLNMVPSSGTLPAPVLPDLYKLFPVKVSFAVNPYNFFVQPLESENQLNELMKSLQERYANVKYGRLNLDDVIAGKIYASKHDDGFWYRTSVIKVIHAGSISVFFCDFGYYQNLTVQQLVPLEQDFLSLPYQALKAKLADIKPKHNKWTMDDCDRFKEMVENRIFFSRIKVIEKDILYDSDYILKLDLIDTSSEIDIFVDQELIKSDIAVKDKA